MEETLHHLGCIGPFKQRCKLPINWCRVSSINSISTFANILNMEPTNWWLGSGFGLVPWFWRIDRIQWFKTFRFCFFLGIGINSILYLLQDDGCACTYTDYNVYIYIYIIYTYTDIHIRDVYPIHIIHPASRRRGGTAPDSTALVYGQPPPQPTHR